MDLKLKQTDFELPVSLTTKAFFITPAIFQPWVKLFIISTGLQYVTIKMHLIPHLQTPSNRLKLPTLKKTLIKFEGFTHQMLSQESEF